VVGGEEVELHAGDLPATGVARETGRSLRKDRSSSSDRDEVEQSEDMLVANSLGRGLHTLPGVGVDHPGQERGSWVHHGSWVRFATKTDALDGGALEMFGPVRYAMDTESDVGNQLIMLPEDVEGRHGQEKADCQQLGPTRETQHRV